MDQVPAEVIDGFMIAAMLQSDAFVNAMQRELKQVYPQIAAEPELIRSILRNSVLRDQVLDPDYLAMAEAKLAQNREKRQTRGTGTLRAVPTPKADDASEDKDDLMNDKRLSSSGG
jgi:hypothetical protein